MDNVTPMVLICVNVQRNFKIFNSMFPSPTAQSKSYVVRKIGTVLMLRAEREIPVVFDVKFQYAWNATVPSLIEMGNTRCYQVLSSMS